MLHMIIVGVTGLQAGVMNIERVIGLQHKHTFDDFVTFLKVLEVYGMGYADDIDQKG